MTKKFTAIFQVDCEGDDLGAAAASVIEYVKDHVAKLTKAFVLRRKKSGNRFLVERLNATQIKTKNLKTGDLRRFDLTDYEDEAEETTVASGPVDEALDIVREIVDAIDAIDKKVRDDNDDFFDSIEKKNKDIGETIDRTRKCSERQLMALRNMRDGVLKWHRED